MAYKMNLEILSGRFGCMAVRSKDNYSIWSCYESSDYHYYAVQDDFGNLVPISNFTNMRGY